MINCIALSSAMFCLLLPPHPFLPHQSSVLAKVLNVWLSKNMGLHFTRCGISFFLETMVLILLDWNVWSEVK